VAGLVLLEPVMRVEVTAPEDDTGEVISDLNGLRGRIQQMETRPGVQLIQVFVPMAEMFGYATDLRSLTQGRGTYTMHFGRYDEVPKTIGEEVVARVTGAARP
jgi:elongation factor G